MSWVDVRLPHDRSQPGRLRLMTEGMALWDCPALGKADNAGAAAHGNPTRDPLRPYGDLPTGTYAVIGVSPVDRGDAEEVDRFGPWGKMVLDPEGGPALEAKRNGRYGLLIHGGRLSPAQRLRPTYGCLRVTDPAIEQIVAHHRADPITRCLVTEEVFQNGTPQEET